MHISKAQLVSCPANIAKFSPFLLKPKSDVLKNIYCIAAAIYTAQKMKKSLMVNFIFCAVLKESSFFNFLTQRK